MTTLDIVSREAAACRVCAAHLPLGPRPVFRLTTETRLLIMGQAPGTKVHASGIPWDDPSGDRLRDWLQMDREQFYGDPRIGVLPTGMCYPGRLPRGGDAPPRPECAPLWHARFLAVLPRVELILLVGGHAQVATLGKPGPGGMAARIRSFREHLPRHFPLPHPSWRTRAWVVRNPWFETEVLPALRQSVAAVLPL